MRSLCTNPRVPPLLRLILQGHSHMHLDSVVKMKSLPFDANQADIIIFFEQYKLKPNGVQLVVRSDNKPTGEVRALNRAAGIDRRCLHRAVLHAGSASCLHAPVCGQARAASSCTYASAVSLTVSPMFASCLQAFVDFESYEEASKAMREKDHKVFNEKFGDRYVRLIQVRSRCACTARAGS